MQGLAAQRTGLMVGLVELVGGRVRQAARGMCLLGGLQLAEVVLPGKGCKVGKGIPEEGSLCRVRVTEELAAGQGHDRERC